jgi:flagellar basal body-associated protein FliL
MSETNEIPPFGADNLPVNELKKEELPKMPVSPDKKNKLVILIFCSVIIVLVAVIGVLVAQMTQKPELVVVSPSPSAITLSPSPSASQSANFSSIGDRIEVLDKNLKNTDLDQTKLLFPLINFSIDFGQKK